MRETITFPRPYRRPLTSVLLVAFLGALLLVLALPVPIHAQRGPITVPAGTTIMVQISPPDHQRL